MWRLQPASNSLATVTAATPAAMYARINPYCSVAPSRQMHALARGGAAAMHSVAALHAAAPPLASVAAASPRPSLSRPPPPAASIRRTQRTSGLYRSMSSEVDPPLGRPRRSAFPRASARLSGQKDASSHASSSSSSPPSSLPAANLSEARRQSMVRIAPRLAAAARRTFTQLFRRASSSDSPSSNESPPSQPPSSPSSSPSPHLFDASHLLTNLDEKRETLPFLEVSDQGDHRDLFFSKAELSTMLELHPRDLRFLDSSMRNLPSILTRRRVIIINLEMFKAIISAERVLMFDPWYPHVKAVVQPLQASVLSGGEMYDNKPLPFEFIALEHILLTVCRLLEARFDVYLRSLDSLISSCDTGDHSSSFASHFSFSSSSSSSSSAPSSASVPSPATAPFDVPDLTLPSTSSFYHSPGGVGLHSASHLNSLIADGSGSTLMHLLQLKHGLTSFEVTLRETGQALRDLLENDEDMAQMSLSLKKAGQEPSSSEHGEVEVILETYLRKVDELENEVEQMVKSISLTEEHIQIRLDTTRNSMMKLELLASICTFGVTSAALGAALFGMNLPNHMEQSPYAFAAVSALFFIASGLIIRKGLTICRKRNIHLLHIEQEPVLHFPHFSRLSAADATHLGKGKRARLAKFAAIQQQQQRAFGGATYNHGGQTFGAFGTHHDRQ